MKTPDRERLQIEKSRFEEHVAQLTSAKKELKSAVKKNAELEVAADVARLAPPLLTHHFAFIFVFFVVSELVWKWILAFHLDLLQRFWRCSILIRRSQKAWGKDASNEDQGS